MARNWVRSGVVCLFCVAVLAIAGSVFAQDQNAEVGAVQPGLEEKAKVDQEWEKAADTNQDGIVDKVEIRQWRHRGKKGQGASDEGESQEMAEESTDQAVADSSQGTSATDVNRPWEKAADTNQDGRVDKTEWNQWNQQGNNAPGAVGGPGSSQGANVGQAADVNRPWEKAADNNQDGRVDKVEYGQWNREGNNPPGQVGGPGASRNYGSQQQDASQVNRPWERKADANRDGDVDRREFGQWNQQGNNPPGQAGGPGSSRNQPRRDNDNNPPGARGGQGTNWENRPGPQGGTGAGPNRQPRRDGDNNPPGARGGAGTNWENRPGPQGGQGASPNRGGGGGGRGSGGGGGRR